jgi:hypothetical protein
LQKKLRFFIPPFYHLKISTPDFSWAQEGPCPSEYLFASCYVAPKNGTYTKKGGYDYPDQSAEYTFKAYDDTEWYLFYATAEMVAGIEYQSGYPLSEGWYLYQLFRDPAEMMFFNYIATRNIIDQW